ncbi:MAG: glycosyltransferase family 1 protein, partial [Gemmatimonadota bacterium]
AVGGIPDALGDPPAGRLVPPGDDAALGEALAAAARDREWRTQVGASVSRRAKVFSLELMMGRYVELYRSLGD